MVSGVEGGTQGVQEWGAEEDIWAYERLGNSGVAKNIYRGADKSLARPTSLCILFDGENISFDASLVIYIYITNIPPIMIISRIYDTQNLLSL